MKIYISLEPIDGVEMYNKIKKEEVYNDVINTFTDDTVLYVSNIYTAYLLNNCCFSSVVNIDSDIPKLSNANWYQKKDNNEYEKVNYGDNEHMLGRNIFDNYMKDVIDDYYTLLNYYNP